MKLFGKWEQNLLLKAKAREEGWWPMGEHRPQARNSLGILEEEHDVITKTTPPPAEERHFARSRLAPSPTGAQHIGNARTFLIAWLDARSIGAELVLRIEDLDTPRTKSWASEQIIEDLTWLGLDWDLRAPDASQRCERYTGILERLRCEERIYPCVCTRSQIEATASAPHESVLDGAVYPGTCRSLGGEHAALVRNPEKPYAWRFPFPPGWQSWIDLLMGPQALDPSQQLGDFIVARSYGPIAYQLAVVVDDHDQGVSRVLRGDDLIYSTFRQLALYDALGWTPPEYMHLPLVVGPDGKRLAKRHGDTRLSTLREQNVAPERLIGYLAWSLGWMPSGCSISARELLGQLKTRPNWQRDLPTTPWVFRIEDL